jgi:hypothetical protein
MTSTGIRPATTAHALGTDRSHVFVWARQAPNLSWATHRPLSVGHAWPYASMPPHIVQTGRALDSASWPCFVFTEFSELVKIIANFKNLHRIDLTSEIMKQILLGRS